MPVADLASNVLVAKQSVPAKSWYAKQRSTKLAGPGTFISRDFTIHAAIDGVIGFSKVRKSRFTGKTTPRTQVHVV